jgi:hypothetical protein
VFRPNGRASLSSLLDDEHCRRWRVNHLLLRLLARQARLAPLAFLRSANIAARATVRTDCTRDGSQQEGMRHVHFMANGQSGVGVDS